MSSYNSIVKVKYTDNLSDVVSLDEYIIFADEKKERKYIVFKFSNNLNQKLFGLKFEVSQYDMHNELIEKSVVIYKDFNAKPNSDFVPKARLNARYACKRISVRLVQAAFDRVLWNEGEFVDNSYKFEHYARDEKYIEEKDRPVQKPPKPKKKKDAKKYNARFTLKNITKKNIAKGPSVFYWIFCLLILAGITASLILFPRQSKSFTLEGYDLQIIEGTNVKLCGYEGDEETLNVPSKIDSYTVVRIGKGAFSRLPAKIITLPATVSAIETGAFSRMNSLQTVSLGENERPLRTMEVYEKAFDGCPALATFNITNAELVKNSLYGCGNVSMLFFKHTNVNMLVSVFGETQHAVKIKYFVGLYDADEEQFFKGVRVSGTNA